MHLCSYAILLHMVLCMISLDVCGIWSWYFKGVFATDLDSCLCSYVISNSFFSISLINMNDWKLFTFTWHELCFLSSNACAHKCLKLPIPFHMHMTPDLYIFICIYIISNSFIFIHFMLIVLSMLKLFTFVLCIVLKLLMAWTKHENYKHFSLIITSF